MDPRLITLLNNAEIEISSYGMHYRTEMEILNRTLPCYVMSYHKSGKAIMRIRGAEYQLSPGQVLLLPPFVSHDHVVEKGIDTELFWWHFTFEISGHIDALRLFGLPYVSEVRDTRTFESVFENYCKRDLKNPDIPGLFYEKSRSFEILAILFENILQQSSYDLADVPDSFISILQDVLEQSTADFSLGQLAERYFLNPTYISNRFKTYFGVSPINLHRQLMIDRAKVMLETAGVSVGDVAARLGFENSQTFSRFFLAKTGMRPSEYRASFR